ncbi:hypothetical protein KRR39_01990 [Nocardioides panacis]|uniref:DUF7144 domain-containing protein n=1 Tax=Nocardioides panacis TaxID=2849501 RepID=A0A975T0K9_9ACTN|nr:hypothetical protein [Nocardioides panacis]QWZ08658.1 hypothetical protein KRR39_01990 [Nocardioides panacis]
MSDMRQQRATGPTAATGATETTGAPGVPQQRGYQAPPEPSAWTGWVTFAAMMMVLLGVFQAIAGLVALFDDGYYLVGPSGLVVNVNYTTWGWVHLIVGLAALAAGFGLFRGAMWARVLGITVASISAIVNFAFIAAFPFWALTMITLDVIFIYAIAAHGRELQNQG